MIRTWIAALGLLLSASLAVPQIIGGGTGNSTAPLINSFGAFANPILITLAYGQSRAAGYSGANDVCYSTWNGTIENIVPEKSFMMNNTSAPGPFNKADFVSSLVTATQEYASCNGNIFAGIPGQDLGSEIIYSQQDDTTFSRGNNARLLVQAGEGGQAIANLVKNGPVTVTDNTTTFISSIADNGSGLARLTVYSSQNNKGVSNCQIGTPPCSLSTAIANGSVQDIINTGTSFNCGTLSTGGPNSNGTWTITLISAQGVDPAVIDLQGSNFSLSNNNGTGPCGYNAAVGLTCTGFNTAQGQAKCGQLGGMVIYTRMQNLVTRACAMIVAVGKTCAVDTVLWLQGEADTQTFNSTNITAYQSTLSTLIGNMRTDIAAITSQATPFEFIMNPPNSTGSTPPTNNGVALVATVAQYNLGILNADGHTWINGPEYPFPNSTVSEHQSPLGVILNGETFGYTRSAITQGTWLGPGTCANSSYLCPTSITSSTNVVTVNLNIPNNTAITGCPSGGVVLDTTPWGADTFGNASGLVNTYGFRFSDDSGATISSVAITGCTQIQVTLSGTPTTNKRLSYANSGPGFQAAPVPPAWGNFRDGRQTTSRYACNVSVTQPGNVCSSPDPNWALCSGAQCKLSDWMLSFSITF